MKSLQRLEFGKNDRLKMQLRGVKEQIMNDVKKLEQVIKVLRDAESHKGRNGFHQGKINKLMKVVE